jgi:hypothetical protein
VEKYYFFSSHNIIDTERFKNAINNIYQDISLIVFLDTKNGYILSDENFFDYLESLLPIIMADTDNSYIFLMSHANDKLTHLALKKAFVKKRACAISLADLILELALDGDYELVVEARNLFATVRRELMQTASAFVSLGLNASLAAQKLYIHRNTFAYRLHHFIEATNLDIRDYHNAQLFSILVKLFTRI